MLKLECNPQICYIYNMAEATDLKEPQEKPEVVRFGQRFRLFRSEKPTVLLELPYLTSAISISPDFEVISRLHKWLNGPIASVSFVPFNPDAGYQIGQEDLDPVSRQAKLDRSYKPDINEELFLFSLRSSSKDSAIAGVDKAVLENLRVQVFFPQGSYEARPSETSMENGKLDFQYFYPIDTGPLPQISEQSLGHIYMHKGHFILLPKDKEKLSKIEARFIPALEEPEKSTPSSRK